VVTEFDGKEIKDLRDLTRAVAATRAGSDKRLKVRRGNEEIALDVTIGEAPQQLASAAVHRTTDGVELGALGLTLARVDDKTRARYGLGEDARGVSEVVVDQSPDFVDRRLVGAEFRGGFQELGLLLAEADRSGSFGHL